MTRLPRDIRGDELAKALERLGYVLSRQRGSHLRLAHPGPPEAHVTIPAHRPIKIGTLNHILEDVASHLHITRHELLARLFG
ncbi:MAG: type II toxin-antitoxin system HicA family toxin [Holophagaceae bacterium]